MKIPPIWAARHLCDLLPSQIRSRVLSDEAFTSQYDGPLSASVMTIGGKHTFDQRKLLAAVRTVVVGGEPQTLRDLSGSKVIVACENGTVTLTESGKDESSPSFKLPELLVLSARSGDRTDALRRLMTYFGPARPDFFQLENAAQNRQLTDEEVSTLMKERCEGFTACRANLTKKAQGDQIQVHDLVPESLRYYEGFCGPVPQVADPEEYLKAVLPSVRQQQLTRDLTGGLEICLLGALRDDLMPGSWTLNISDDALWGALQAIDHPTNPFVALGKLDIALTRLHDHRYETLAADMLGQLCQDTLLRPDQVDGYELLPLFAQLTLNQLNQTEGGALHPPFWKRLCAWMHAGLMVHSFSQGQLKMEPLHDWIENHRSWPGIYAELLDLCREPMYLAGQFSRAGLRKEIIGRLMILKVRTEAAGRSIPRSEDIEAAVSRLTREGDPLAWAMPGPLDGHFLPSKQDGRRLPDVDVNKILAVLSQINPGDIWIQLAYFSQYFDLGQPILARVCERYASMNIQTSDVAIVEWNRCLFNLGIVAAAHRNHALAEAIGNLALKLAPLVSTPNDAISLLHNILLASTAVESPTEWSVWTRAQLERLASNLPAGEVSKALYVHLRAVKEAIPLELDIISRAEAIASSAT